MRDGREEALLTSMWYVVGLVHIQPRATGWSLGVMGDFLLQRGCAVGQSST